MAQVTKTVCDVFGTCKDVQRIQVTLTILASDEHAGAPDVADLSPRAQARLERFIERGLVSAATWKEVNGCAH